MNSDNKNIQANKKLDAILQRLILKSIQDSKDGKGISHGEMMQKVKVKYPFLK